MISRRALLGGSVGVALGTSVRAARADERTPDAPMPVGFVGHGSPLLAIDPVRGPALAAWGASLPRPRGIVVMTPHYGVRRLELGAVGRGVAMHNMPGWIARQLPAGLDYPSPPNDALAAGVERALAGHFPVVRGARAGFDHTTWIPLRHLFAAADVPVLELAYPYVDERGLLALGRALAPLCGQGVFFLASGGITHNLAAIDPDLGDRAPRWSSEFDAWAAETVAAREVDALLDWRAKAPAANLAHPDDGAHFRVLLVALGVALEAKGDQKTSFPVRGYEAGLSVRSIQLG